MNTTTPKRPPSCRIVFIAPAPLAERIDAAAKAHSGRIEISRSAFLRAAIEHALDAGAPFAGDAMKVNAS